MDLNVSISFVLPPSLERFFNALSAALVAGAFTAAGADDVPASVVDTANPPPAGDAAPAKRRGRPPKSAEANGATPPAAAQESAPPAAPAPAPAAPAAAPAPAAEKLTVTQVGAIVQEVLNTIGVPAMRSIFAKFDAKKVLDIPEDKFPAFVAALREAQGMVKP